MLLLLLLQLRMLYRWGPACCNAEPLPAWHVWFDLQSLNAAWPAAAGCLVMCIKTKVNITGAQGYAVGAVAYQGRHVTQCCPRIQQSYCCI